MNKNLSSHVVDAKCPHCNSSFVKGNAIVNHAHRNTGEVIVVQQSIVPGSYEKTIKNKTTNNAVVLCQKEKVVFFCEKCYRELTLPKDESLFEMNVTTKEGKSFAVLCSAIYNEHFTVVFVDGEPLFFGHKRPNTSEFLKEILLHYTNADTFVPWLLSGFKSQIFFNIRLWKAVFWIRIQKNWSRYDGKINF